MPGPHYSSTGWAQYDYYDDFNAFPTGSTANLAGSSPADLSEQHYAFPQAYYDQRADSDVGPPSMAAVARQHSDVPSCSTVAISPLEPFHPNPAALTGSVTRAPSPSISLYGGPYFRPARTPGLERQLRYAASSASSGPARSAAAMGFPVCDATGGDMSQWNVAADHQYKSTGVVAAPQPQLLSNASQMAVLLHDPAALQEQPLPSLPIDDEDQPDYEYGMIQPEDEEELFRDGREKRHGCTMCHKRFDRPSTLKKHLLVHTGEKAFQCSLCQRRFGVMSNLNRHIRRCSQREVHLYGTKGKSMESIAQVEAALKTGKSDSTTKRTPKRRRRPPSPSRWVPPSLRSFNLLPPEASPPANLPLDPVSPARSEAGPLWAAYEDRDSYDENVGSAPYRDAEWNKKRRLPGPAPVMVQRRFAERVRVHV
ncbi:C2H2 conidiation transcriptional factor [Mycena indigotica]|uniref:C2H2 conidiation transcriptional factor n=1 Tax=Mycena indigotica TaxID=2126181 RepID=A0A8H6S5D1_9AGAR|nr:C2H2 conidiation transcriptional factor [Mycena indigotica]KAF7292643.1 C2H2 conidiation transcriptional factor [Mycena indigotica]